MLEYKKIKTYLYYCSYLVRLINNLKIIIDYLQVLIFILLIYYCDLFLSSHV